MTGDDDAEREIARIAAGMGGIIADLQMTVRDLAAILTRPGPGK